MSEKEQRIMRMALPVSLIREMDAVIIQGLGGYRTRAEFIVDAIQERILEVTIGETEDAGPPPHRRLRTSPQRCGRCHRTTASARPPRPDLRPSG